ncbi:cell wall-active antibiotics response protein LiaF [Dethiobacter alkaliphilus]|uniref:cell wall-active antibiotics response protein LiaF n=1 Tax=Dethiobacter alkaliphilus TaxID=427926 RepID=UPI002227C603|nr:cell wall-active antibiotics response protein LiaF [Dethiobacter alkaliphilus]MCW3490597.1 cell wall-active antibiotics response protein LiaF [Dethiobacter alkaliphilus]
MGKSFGQSLLALLLIAGGVLLLLVNIGVLDAGISTVWQWFYPSALVLYGFYLIIESVQRMARRRRFNLDWYWGLALALLGGLLLSARFEIIDFSLGRIWQMWPLLVVYAGLTIFFDDDDEGDWCGWECEDHECWSCDGKAENGEGDTKKRSYHFGKKRVSVGQMKRTRENWSAEPVDLRSAIGEYEFDFTRAFIPEEEIPVRMSGWVGDVKMLIPRDVEFAVKVRATVGDVYVAGRSQEGFNPSLHYKTPGYDDAVRKLTIEIGYKILDLRIDQV